MKEYSRSIALGKCLRSNPTDLEGLRNCCNLVPKNGYFVKAQIQPNYSETIREFVSGAEVTLLDNQLVCSLNAIPFISPAQIDIIDYGWFGLIVDKNVAIYSSYNGLELFHFSARSGCDYNGVVILGGIEGYADLGLNTILWSKPGTIDFSIDHSGEAGWVDTNIGEVLKIGRLGDKIIAYGSVGATTLVLTEQGFGIKEQFKLPVESKGCVCCTEEAHLVVSEEVYILFPGEVKKLGLKEYIFQLNLAKARSYWSSELESFLLTDDEKTLLINSFGGSWFAGVPVGRSMRDLYFSVLDLSSAWLFTNFFDFNSNARKTLSTIEVIGENIEGLRVIASGDALVSRNQNPLHIYYIPLSFQQLAVGLEVEDFVSLRGIRMRYKYTEKLHTRGIYVTDQNTGS